MASHAFAQPYPMSAHKRRMSKPVTASNRMAQAIASEVRTPEDLDRVLLERFPRGKASRDVARELVRRYLPPEVAQV
jgi:hypothetical protein